MLSIGKIAAGPAAARYYTVQVSANPAAYYSGDGEAPGYWLGSGSRGPGLSGTVTSDALTDVLAGAGQRTVGKVAGFDLTFKAPKSVSLLWALGDPELGQVVWAAQRKAVGEALGYLEREACVVRRGKGGVVQLPASGFLAAGFEHRTSRAGDPLVHTHVVVGNLGLGPDGRWTALDARHLFAHAKTAGYLHEAVLRRELKHSLGLEWTQVVNGIGDVRGVPRPVIDAFSKRRHQILERMAERGESSPRAAQIAALDTREAKDDRPLPERRDSWRQEATELDFGGSEIESLVSVGRAPRPPAEVVLNALTENSSAFTRGEVLQAVAQAAGDGATVAEIENAADALLAGPDVVRLEPDGLNQRRFTSTQLLATERALLDRADRSQHEHRGVAIDHVDAAIARRASISDDQAAAVRELCAGPGGIAVLRAPAGTGKTFAMDAARDAWTRAGHTVIGCSTSARAARELQDQAGIRSTTIAQLRGQLSAGGQLPSGSVLVVDEAGMVGTRPLTELALAAEEGGAKLVLVGDDRQLPEIEAGGAFRALAKRLDAVELTEVRRQVEPWDRRALEALRSGDVERWARAYRDAGRITVAPTAEQARSALVSDYLAANGDKIMLACRRDDLADLNARARAVLEAEGTLGANPVSYEDREFAAGDRVVAVQNARRLGLLNGQRGVVEATGDAGLEIRLDNGDAVTLTRDKLDLVDHGYAMTAHRAQGATVDRAYVLGSPDLYREWGYTAMSRHREEARFYVAGPDLGLDRDQAPSMDPLIDALTRTLGRSNAEQLASEQLATTPTADLKSRLAELAPRVAHGVVPDERELREERQREYALAKIHWRNVERLTERLDALPRFSRSERRHLESEISSYRAEAESHTTRGDACDVELTHRGDKAERWITEHREDATDYIKLKTELDSRNRDVIRATHAVQQLDRTDVTQQLEFPGHEVEL